MRFDSTLPASGLGFILLRSQMSQVQMEEILTLKKYKACPVYEVEHLTTGISAGSDK